MDYWLSYLWRNKLNNHNMEKLWQIEHVQDVFLLTYIPSYRFSDPIRCGVTLLRRSTP